MTNGARKALITGGASGFGLAIARAGISRGWDVVIADLARGRLDRAQDEHPQLRALELDVTDADNVREVVDRTIQLLGGLDTVICSAGVIHVKDLEDVRECDWDLTLAVNLKGAFLVAQAAAKSLSESKRGRMVLLSSMSGKRGHARMHAYAASKFGLIGLAESLADELAPSRVTVNCICPASSPSTGMGRMLAGADGDEAPGEDALRELAATFPLGRYIEEHDVVAAAMYLLSDGAEMITGSTIDLDGGRRFRAA